MSNSIKILSTLVIGLFIKTAVFAQCCSSGSPAGASTYVGVLNKKTIRTIVFYRNNYSDTYYTGKSKSEDFQLVKYSNFNYSGLTLGYGISNRITAEYEMGYFISKTQQFNVSNNYSATGVGLANGSFLIKYGALMLPSKNIELTVGGGLKFPFALEDQVENHVPLPRDVQPSTGAYGFTSQLFFNKGFPAISMKIFTLNKFEINGKNKSDYQYGTYLMNSLFISKKIVKNFFGVLQLRREERQHDMQDDVETKNTGSKIVFISPQLSYSIAGKWHVAVMSDIPVYKNYTGRQLTPKRSFAVSLTKDFSTCKAKN